MKAIKGKKSLKGIAMNVEGLSHEAGEMVHKNSIADVSKRGKGHLLGIHDFTAKHKGKKIGMVGAKGHYKFI